MGEESLRCVVANVLDLDIFVSELEIQSYHYVSFRTNNLEKSMNTISPRSAIYGLNGSIAVHWF